METSIIPQEIVSVKLQVGYAIVTTLHPTKGRRILEKKNTKSTYNMQYKGYFYKGILKKKKKKLPFWRNPNLPIVPSLGRAT